MLVLTDGVKVQNEFEEVLESNVFTFPYESAPSNTLSLQRFRHQTFSELLKADDDCLTHDSYYNFDSASD